MSEDATFQSNIDDSEGLIIDEEYDYSQFTTYGRTRFYIELCYFPLQIIVVLPCNILILAILIRRRLWLRHEAYLYLAIILSIDSLRLIFSYGDFWMNLFDHRVIRMSIASEIVCKFWLWLVTIFYIEWLHVLMLLNVSLRQQLTTRSDGRGCCTSLTAKYCTLFGTKVVLGSYFTVCFVANFWSFATAGLYNHGESWYCHYSASTYTQHMLLTESWLWLGLYTSWSVLLAQLLLIAWKRKRLSGFAFSRMNGDTPDDFDAEVLTNIAVGCSVATCITGASGFLSHVLHTNVPNFEQPKSRLIVVIIAETFQLIYLAQPLSTAVVCFAVKSRLRDDLKSIVGRCWSIFTCLRTLPSEPDNDRSSVLQMSPIEEDDQVRQEEDDSLPIILQT